MPPESSRPFTSPVKAVLSMKYVNQSKDSDLLQSTVVEKIWEICEFVSLKDKCLLCLKSKVLAFQWKELFSS